MLVGAQQMRRGIAGLPPRETAADASSEAILSSLTGEREVPRRLMRELAKLPADGAVLVLRPPNQILTSLPAYMAAYHALPRQVLIREVQIADSPAAVEELRKNFAAVVFVGSEPPVAFPPGLRFGTSFVFVPL